MSNLEELIERLCPDGVEYKTLGDVATISRGGNFQRRTLQNKESLVFIMVKYIHAMVCLLIIR